jgi:hypothetical protein
MTIAAESRLWFVVMFVGQGWANRNIQAIPLYGSFCQRNY